MLWRRQSSGYPRKIIEVLDSANPMCELNRRLHRLLVSVKFQQNDEMERIYRRLEDMQIISGLEYLEDWEGDEDEHRRRKLDDPTSLRMLQKIFDSGNKTYGIASLDGVVVLEDDGSVHMTKNERPMPCNAVEVSARLVNLINWFGLFVINVLIQLQLNGMDAFYALEKLQYILCDLGLPVENVAEVALNAQVTKLRKM